MRTLVDGNNLLYAFPPLRGLMISKHRDAARQGLVEHLSRLVKSGKLHAPVTVVFDGRASAPVASGAEACGIEARFAPHPDTADRLIGDLVAYAATLDEVTVITSDRELQASCRRLGAKVLGVWKFLQDYAPEGRERGAGAHKRQGRGRVASGSSSKATRRGARGRPRRRRAGSEIPKDAPSTEKPPGALPEPEIRKWLEEFGFEEE